MMPKYSPVPHALQHHCTPLSLPVSSHQHTMQILNIALQSMFLSGSTDDVVAGTSAGTDTTAPAASIDARVSPEEVEKGFVAVSSKRTYHKKLAQFTFFLLDNKPECLADGYREELQHHDKLDNRRNAVDCKNAHAAGKWCKKAT